MSFPRFVMASVLCPVVFGIAPLNAAEVPDGIYVVVSEGQGKTVSRSTGEAVEIGECVATGLGTPRVWSLSNENDRFRILLTGIEPFDSQPRHVVCIDGVCDYLSSYSDPREPGGMEVIADFSGYTNAQKVAARLKTELIERKHPGHQLRVSWHPVDEEFKVGDAVNLELRIVNVGETIVRFMEGGQQRGARDNQFGFTAFSGSGFGKAVSDTGDPMNFGGIGAFRELKPGETFSKQVDITKWFKFTEPDTYEITGFYELELMNEDFSVPVLWEEFATGRCRVRLVE